MSNHSNRKLEDLLSGTPRYSRSSTSNADWETVYDQSLTSIRDASHFNLHSRNNIVDLDIKDEDHVIAYMKHRYLNKEFYTWAGQTLLSIHPYEDITPVRCANTSTPSVDSVVSKAWFKLERNIGKQNQALVISGESGSGKTYSACLAMKTIASLQQNVNNSGTILWQTWYSVPLLTAFGNAPNQNNNNSSRFGKLLQLQWSNGQIVGAFIRTFLLEKSRVTGPNTHEGNFHIFRQILDSVDSDTLGNLYLDTNISYKIAPPPENIIRSTYTETVKALKMLNISELSEIQIVLAVILNLGNVGFALKEDQCYVTKDSQRFLGNAAKLLKVEYDGLLQLLVTKTFMAKPQGNKRDTIYTSACSNKEECVDRRNCLMRFLYNNLFLWLIDSINEQIYINGNFKLLGILDIYGFETFDNNTFEQLCINYANERLQQYFVNDYLVKQKEDLVAEGLQLEEFDTTVYAARIDLLDGPISIFGILNEECTMKRFNTDVFVNIRLAENFCESKYFENPCNNFSTTFVIKHFAGNVAYSTKTMLYKNRDKIPDEMISFLKECKFPFLECILQTEKLTNKTLLGKFKKSLDNLMETLNEADVHYIKCLKPNNFQVSGFVDEPYLTQQMKANGVLDILKLDFQGYQIKYPFEDFIKTFTCNLFNCLQYVLKDSIHIGKKFIYLNERTLYYFEMLKFVQRSIAARKIQRWWIRYKTKRKTAAVKIQRFYREILMRKSLESIDNFIDLSKKSSEIFVGHQTSSTNLTVDQYVTSCQKAEEYLKTQNLNANYEGEPLSLYLEKVYDSIQTKKFKRVLFFGHHIISYNRLAEVPVRLHLSKTCIPYSNLLPKSELAKGLTDIF